MYSNCFVKCQFPKNISQYLKGTKPYPMHFARIKTVLMTQRDGSIVGHRFLKRNLKLNNLSEVTQVANVQVSTLPYSDQGFIFKPNLAKTILPLLFTMF